MVSLRDVHVPNIRQEGPNIQDVFGRGESRRARLGLRIARCAVSSRAKARGSPMYWDLFAAARDVSPGAGVPDKAQIARNPNGLRRRTSRSVSGWFGVAGPIPASRVAEAAVVPGPAPGKNTPEPGAAFSGTSGVMARADTGPSKMARFANRSRKERIENDCRFTYPRHVRYY